MLELRIFIDIFSELVFAFSEIFFLHFFYAFSEIYFLHFFYAFSQIYFLHFDIYLSAFSTGFHRSSFCIFLHIFTDLVSAPTFLTGASPLLGMLRRWVSCLVTHCSSTDWITDWITGWIPGSQTGSVDPRLGRCAADPLHIYHWH